MRKLGVSTLLLLLLMTSFARSQKKPATKPKSPASGNAAWVESTLKKMTLREKLGQMLMPHYFGVFTSAESAEYKALLHQVEENHVGGFIVGTERGPLGIERSQVYPTAVLTNELQKRAKVPLLIGADFESGTGMRLDEGTSFPSAMAIGATNDPQLAYARRQSDRAGITRGWRALDFRAGRGREQQSGQSDHQYSLVWRRSQARGRIRDASNSWDRRKWRAGDRQAFSGPWRCERGFASCAGDGSRGPQGAGGHGAGSLPRCDCMRMWVRSCRDILQCRRSSRMPTVPATTSRKILTGLLRDEMKFKGLVVTDAMDMGGVTSLYPPGEAAIRAVEAGADVLLMPPVPDAAMAGLERAVRSGRLTEKRIDESVRRILQAKARLGLDKNRFADIERLDQKFGRPEFETQAQSIADRGVTLLRDTPHLVPLDATKPLRVLLVSLSADADPYPGETIEPEIRWRVDSLKALARGHAVRERKHAEIAAAGFL